MFVVILKYVAPLEKIDAYREEHLCFLDRYYKCGIFIASGPQIPRTGGIIIARCSSKQILEKILHEDPFYIHGFAEHQIYEFTPTKHSVSFKPVVEEQILPASED